MAREFKTSLKNSERKLLIMISGKTWKAYYRNDYAPGIIPVNLIFSIGKVYYPESLFSQSASFSYTT